MKSFLVIGLGSFGRHLAIRLQELGNEVMVLDRDEERVARLAKTVTAACVGDCQDEQVLASLGIGNFNACFSCSVQYGRAFFYAYRNTVYFNI